MIKSKKGLSTIIVVLIFVVLSISAVFIINYSLKKITTQEFGDQVSCFDSYAVVQSFFIKDACYLNDNEIAVDVERKADTLNVEALKFAFIGEQTNKWIIEQEKCLDVRTINSSYGGYCSVVKQNMDRDYVFNVSDLDTKNQVKLVIQQNTNGKVLSCLIDQRKIDERC